MNPQSTSRDRYFDNRKNNVIFTPPPLCKWLADLVTPAIGNFESVFDPAVGSGNLLEPFSNTISKIGCDIKDFNPQIDAKYIDDFLTWQPPLDAPSLTISNPPYNHSDKSRKKYGRDSLLPELFAAKVFELFGNEAPLILFTPMGLRLNTRSYTAKQGDRYRRIRDDFGKITSIISLPLDIFPNPDFDVNFDEQRRSMGKFNLKFPNMTEDMPQVQANKKKYFLESNIKRKETHQEILIFNIPKLDPHYCLPDSVIEDIRNLDRAFWGAYENNNVAEAGS